MAEVADFDDEPVAAADEELDTELALAVADPVADAEVADAEVADAVVAVPAAEDAEEAAELPDAVVAEFAGQDADVGNVTEAL